MTIARHLTRPMLAAVFISGGVDTLRNPGPRVELAADVATATAEALPLALPKDPETLVKLDAAAKIAGGSMLASGGRTARLGALICAASLVPTTIAGHRFWAESDPAKKAGQQADFAKNVSLLGGLLIAALDTGGRPSVPWRARRKAARAQAGLAQVGRLTRRQAPAMTTKVHDAANTSLHEVAGTLHERAETLGSTLAAKATAAGGDLSARADALADRAGDVDLAGIGHGVANRASSLRDRAADLRPA